MAFYSLLSVNCDVSARKGRKMCKSLNSSHFPQYSTKTQNVTSCVKRPVFQVYQRLKFTCPKLIWGTFKKLLDNLMTRNTACQNQARYFLFRSILPNKTELYLTSNFRRSDDFTLVLTKEKLFQFISCSLRLTVIHLVIPSKVVA